MARVRWVFLLSGLLASSCSQSNQTPSPAPGSAPATTPPAASSTHDHAGPPTTVADWAKVTKLCTFHRKITTSSPEAQRYFDQGMRFLWAVNHDESTRSFAEAAALDPA